MKVRKFTASKAPTAVPVSIAATGATIAVEANPNRISCIVQNVGTMPVLIRLGGTASATAYNVVLTADTSAKAGNGGVLQIDDYVGYISAITESSTSTLAITELI